MVVDGSSRGGSASAPAFALFTLHRPGRVGRLLADALPLCCSGGCFAALSFGFNSLRTDALPSLLVGRVDALPP